MKIRKILIALAIPGMIVADDVYTQDGHLIIAKETTLTDRIITRLEFYGATELTIYSESDFNEIEAFPTDVDIVTDSFYDTVRKSESFHRFHMAYMNTVDKLKRSLLDLVENQKEIQPEELLSDVNFIIKNSTNNIELFQMLHCMRQYDDTTYVHSLNVALICNIIGKWLHFTLEDQEVLTLCGLLHDIGKLMIPPSIIAKPARLTEEEFTTIKTHTIRGYNLLKGKSIDQRIKNATLMHHERCDGSGYPYGFRANQIDPFAKIIAVVDVYDAMTSARVYRGPLCPFEVISIFETEGFTKYEPKYIMTFLEGIVQTYVNNTVRLSNGIEGQIVLINKLSLSKPIVKAGDQFIDLSKSKDLSIVEIL